jgi:nucleoside-diphosphate-sugar epimerase
MNTKNTVLVIGSAGQIGTDLVTTLRENLGGSNVIASDVKDQQGYLKDSGPFHVLDVLDAKSVFEIIKSHQVSEIYILAALLSATAEEKVQSAWKLNMEGLLNILNIAKENTRLKVFWPSSIAVFGSTTPRINTPQTTIMEPSTVYGISKLSGERWCEYYNHRYNVDVRSIRYPGLISFKAHPGGGTTDYAVDIFHKALAGENYECYLKADTALPMMYMPDAIRATLELMNAPADQIKIRSSYNLQGITFTPEEIAAEIKKIIPAFKITYNPDSRQKIADSWPASIDDTAARQHWNWKPQYDITSMTKEMIEHIRQENSKTVQI